MGFLGKGVYVQFGTCLIVALVIYRRLTKLGLLLTMMRCDRFFVSFLPLLIGVFIVAELWSELHGQLFPHVLNLFVGNELVRKVRVPTVVEHMCFWFSHASANEKIRKRLAKLFS